MRQPSASFLLSNPSLVAPVAPWCAALDNLELGILLLTQPWLAGGGQRRADLERQLSRLAVDLPIGPIYFQRVKRAVTRLGEIGAVRSEGSGRSGRFVVTPRGFAALILNLRVLREDPTIDGSEFELKRALVAMWNLVFERFSALPEELPLDPEMEAFFDEVESLEVWDRKVITDEMLGRALDILVLIADQSRRVKQLLAMTESRLEQLRSKLEEMNVVDLARLAESRGPGAASSLARDPAAAEMIRTIATTALPGFNLRAAALRYRRYLEYLEDLAGMYSRELRVVDFEAIRQLSRRT
jgi:hypothetical protein